VVTRLLLAVHAYLLHEATCISLATLARRCHVCLDTRDELISAHDEAAERLERGERLEGVDRWPSSNV
jgi:hypothetical protein